MQDNKNSNFDGKSTVQYIKAMRDSILSYMEEHSISAKELSNTAGIPASTLNKILYVEEQDCKLSTAIALAKAMGITINELTGAGLLDEPVQRNIVACRSLPQHSIFLIRWFIKHQLTLHQSASGPDHKVISVMEPLITNDGLSKASNTFRSLDISDLPSDLKHKIFFGILIKRDFFMPKYAPGNVLLIANDRNAFPHEHVVIIIGEDLFLATMRTEDGVRKFYGILDGKYRCDEHEISEILGYIVNISKMEI